MEREEGGDIERTSSISSRMFTYVFAIDEEGSRLVCSIQFQKDLLAFPIFGKGDTMAVPAYSAIIVFFGIGISIPSMRQVDVCPLAVVEGTVCSGSTFAF